jgi:hypothetical protein
MRGRILDVPIKQKWFDCILRKKKKIEYRDFGPFWKSRLEGRDYDQIRFRNGYATTAPTLYTEYLGVRKNSKTRKYEIRIGRILKQKYLRSKV